MPVDEDLRRLFSAALGVGGVLHSGSLLAPRDAGGVAAALRLADLHRVRLRLSSGGRLGSPPRPGGAVLSLSRLAALSADPANGVARAEAGVSLADLTRTLAAAGLGVAGLGPRPQSRHVGALVARGEIPRRSLTGIEACLAGGDLVDLGASVLKDVVGYDLISVLLGARGRLAAVVSVHLRLAPAGAGLPTAAAGGGHDVGELEAVFDPHGILAGG